MNPDALCISTTPTTIRFKSDRVREARWEILRLADARILEGPIKTRRTTHGDFWRFAHSRKEIPEQNGEGGAIPLMSFIKRDDKAEIGRLHKLSLRDFVRCGLANGNKE